MGYLCRVQSKYKRANEIVGNSADEVASAATSSTGVAYRKDPLLDRGDKLGESTSSESGSSSPENSTDSYTPPNSR